MSWMVFRSLNDIPYTIFSTYIIKYLDIKEVGVLSMVSKTLKEVFSANDIWKELYFKTNPLEITDNSIHIGPHEFHKHLNKTKILEYHNICKPCYWDIATGTIKNSERLESGCLHGIRMFQHGEFKSLTNSSISHNENVLFIKDQCESVRNEYYDYNKAIHKNINKKDGCNLVNLCRNKSHYISETLEVRRNENNFKSYKKVTLEKLHTKAKNKISKNTSNLKAQQQLLSSKIKLLSNIQKRIDNLKKVITLMETNLVKDNNFKTNSEISINLINKQINPNKKFKNLNKKKDVWSKKYPKEEEIKEEDKWYQYLSIKENKTYYHNNIKNITTWDVPRFWICKIRLGCCVSFPDVPIAWDV